MKISDLARASGTSADTIRYYEKLGLLPAPQRTAAGWRCYGVAHAERLSLIRQARALGMSLHEVRALLVCFDQCCADCAGAHALLDAHLGHISGRIRQLRALERQLKALRARCNGHCEGAHCAIVHGIAEQAASGVPPAPVDGIHPHAPPA
ncbi:MAG: Cd(II)/Pb(II)-responsive transcriptional regulator [Ottowia sp.]|nr:Cd(II)/Pb(II)-responsive transcriptional regulator [Ottowia sp.]